MRIAAIGLCDPGYGEAFARAQHVAAVAHLRKSVPDVVDAGLQPDERTAPQALAMLQLENAKAPFDALLLVQSAWARPDVLLQILRAFPRDLPILLYAPGSPIVDGRIQSTAPAAGAGSSLHILRRHGVKHRLVWSAPGKAVPESEFMPFLRAAHAARKLSGVKLGMVGFGDMRLQMSGFDVQEVHETFGVEVESMDMLELQNGMAAVSGADLAQQTRSLLADWRFPGTPPAAETLERSVAMYLALDRRATERGYTALSIKCPTGVSAHMGMSPCLAACLLARKYHFVCENDVPGMITQTVLGLLSGKMTTYWELYEVLDDGILMGCCGFSPECFLSEPFCAKAFESFVSGIGCCSKVSTGAYTLARLGKEPGGGYAINCVEGRADEPPAWYEAAVGKQQHPSVKFVPEKPVAVVMREVLAQHFAIVPGRHGEALREFAAIKNIRAF